MSDASIELVEKAIQLNAYYVAVNGVLLAGYGRLQAIAQKGQSLSPIEILELITDVMTEAKAIPQ